MKTEPGVFRVSGQLLARWSIGTPIPRGILKAMIRSLSSVNLDNFPGGELHLCVDRIGVRRITQRGGKRKTLHGLHGHHAVVYLMRFTVSTSTTENTDVSAKGAPPESTETMSSGNVAS